MDSNILRIEYLNGYSTGKMVIDMYEFFPCPQKKLRKLWKVMCMGTKQMDDYVDQILHCMVQKDNDLRELVYIFSDKKIENSRQKLKNNMDLLLKLTGRSE